MIRYLLHIIIFFPLMLYSQTYEGKIVRIIDGDNVLFQTKDSTFVVHMYGIDAPEKGQTYGEHTVAHLETYLWDEAEIRLKRDINQQGISALLYVNGKYINKDLVKKGFAWHDKPHSIDGELAYTEIRAREKKEGLWISDNPTPPWDFRAGKLAKPHPEDGRYKVLICTNPKKGKYYHKDYCKELILCHDNIIVITREQAKELKIKACKYCY